jgi:hypothetical protein
MSLVIAFVLNALFSGAILWLASRITKVRLLFKEAVICAAASALVGLIPTFVGVILSIIVFFYVLKHFTQADIWPDLILMVLVSKVVSLLLVLVLTNHILLRKSNPQNHNLQTAAVRGVIGAGFVGARK